MAMGLGNFRSLPAVLRFGITVLAGLSLDLWTKWFAFKKLAIALIRLPSGRIQIYPQPPYVVIPRWLSFEVTPNYGAVFGLGQGWRLLFLGVSVVAIFFLGYLFAVSGKRPWYQIILGMLLAGVLGNMYDRVALGYVRDFIHALPGWQHAFPWIFNVADSLLCVGVFLMIVSTLFPSKSAELSPATNV